MRDAICFPERVFPVCTLTRPLIQVKVDFVHKNVSYKFSKPLANK